MELISVLFLVIGVAIGFAIAHFKSKSESSRLEERNANLDTQLKEAEEKLKEETGRAGELDRQLAGLKAEYSGLQEKLAEQKEEVAQMQEQLKVQFENLANKILDEKSAKFTKQNRESLDQLLDPLGKKLEEFKKKVEDTHLEDVKGRSALEEHLKNLKDLNQQMSEEAKNLTKALKGDSKAQGNWGEVILERVLEKSGLTKGREYEVQQSATTEEGRRLQPDVVVHLPDEKYLIIDSKVSLTAYERFSSSDDEIETAAALKQHVTSLRAHVKSLSEKNYQHIHGDRSPDFVLLFVPIESAFGMALQADPDLYYEAFDRNIVIVSPSTLLATLATIDSVWKQEYQNKNALEIAQRGGALYDKFVLFVESLDQVGARIEQTQKSYDEAKARLTGGAGNLVRQAEMLKELGAKATKRLPESFSGNGDAD